MCPKVKISRMTHLGDVAVLDGSSLVQRLPLDPLGGQAAAGDGGPAPECLELGVHNLTIIINLVCEKCAKLLVNIK